MKQDLKNELIKWLFECESYEVFKNKVESEIDKKIKEDAINELVRKLPTNCRKMLNLEYYDIRILKTYFGLYDKGTRLTVLQAAILLDSTWAETYQRLQKIKEHINREIKKRKLKILSPNEIRYLSIDEFNFPNRIANVLYKNGIHSVKQLTDLTIKNLMSMNDIGKKTAEQIIEYTHNQGLGFIGERIETTEEKLRREYEKKLQNRYNIEQEINYPSDRSKQKSILLKMKMQIEDEIEELSEQLEKIHKRKNKTKLKKF